MFLCIIELGVFAKKSDLSQPFLAHDLVIIDELGYISFDKETTRNYEIMYGMDQPSLSTKLIKGEPLRQEYRGGGGFGSQDKKDYIEFMKRIMNQEFPKGHYAVNGFAEFDVIDRETKQKKKYNIKSQVEFMVKNSN